MNVVEANVCVKVRCQPREYQCHFKATLRALLFCGFSAAAFAQCVYTLNPSTPFIDATAQNVVVQVTASSQTCVWTPAGNGFATISGAAGDTGNGSVTYAVTANPTATFTDRSGSLGIAGSTIKLTQRGTVAAFSDVFPADFDFNGANVLSHTGGTSGCAVAPTGLPLYCPNANVTRGEMAVFLVRMVTSGGNSANAANANNFTYSTTAYFTDVLPGPVNLPNGSPNPNYSSFSSTSRNCAIWAFRREPPPPCSAPTTT